ncbi:IclR family transcriptional regulator [Paenibacillus glycanilyticus]|uniref:IclR family transcriptional regulator n=1 Tax=Paenibacillus glycanilyticus TaxID=126569 RepID=UPI003EC012A7
MLKTLDNSLELLHYFTKETPQWGVRELAKAMGMNHSIVFRILATFEQHGFLVQDKDSKKYSLGMKFMEFGAIVRDQFRISDVILPIMQQLSADTGESIYLTWRDGLEGICVEIVESSQTIRYGVTVGSRSPLFAGASNKVILAFLPEEELESIQLQPFTDKTITSKEDLIQDLEKIRVAGWAYSVGEYTESVFALSLPLFNSSKEVVASITVGGPDFRMPQQKVEPTLQKLIRGRDEMQALIGKLAGAASFRGFMS